MISKMHLLITGATGLIASAYIKRFIHKYDLTILTRSPSTIEFTRGVNVITSIAELNDLNDFDVVINLQGEPIFAKRWTAAQKKEIEDSRIYITQTLATLTANSSNPPHTFISGSAIGFYGRQPSNKIIKEDYKKPYPEFSHQLCSKWEKAALKASKNTRVCLLRTGIVLSTRGGALSQMLPSFKLGLGSIIASGQQVMSWIHIDDMVCAIDYIITHQDIDGPINLTAPNPVTNNTFVNSLAKQLKKPRFLKMPAKLMHLLLGEASDLLVYGQNVLPSKLQSNGFTFHYDEINKALNNLLDNA